MFSTPGVVIFKMIYFKKIIKIKLILTTDYYYLKRLIIFYNYFLNSFSLSNKCLHYENHIKIIYIPTSSKVENIFVESLKSVQPFMAEDIFKLFGYGDFFQDRCTVQ